MALARTDMQILTYEWGVTYAGMLRSAQVTGDKRYSDYTHQRVLAIATLAAHAKKNLSPGTTHANYPVSKHGLGLRSILLPGRLDDSGAMCAALIKAELAGLGDKKLRPWIDNYVQYVSSGQFRLEDGTLARNRPLPNSLWLDDLYMSVPCLAQAGKLTGERRYYDDAAKQILQFADRMFVKDKGLFMHAWVQDMKHHPAFHWARANGWAIMATVELLEVLPEDHPARPRILALLRAHAAGLTAAQGHAGRWHQLLDRSESYEETSASAMFVFAHRAWHQPRLARPAGVRPRRVPRLECGRGQSERERAGGRHLRGHGRGLGSHVLHVSPGARAGRAWLRAGVSGGCGDDRAAQGLSEHHPRRRRAIRQGERELRSVQGRRIERLHPLLGRVAITAGPLLGDAGDRRGSRLA